MKMRALRAALPFTLPILMGFLVLGISYGFLMRSLGFSFIYPVAMSIVIFAGSMQFVANSLLLAAFDPVYAFLLTLMVNTRHLFYGVSLLDKYRGCGWKKPYMIYALCDETFSINVAATTPPQVDRGWFMFFVTLLNQAYWVLSVALGALLGDVLRFDTTGVDFVMTALFVVLFVNQWLEADDHVPALVGLGCSLLCLFILGSDDFMLPAMGLIILFFSLRRRTGQKQQQEPTEVSQ